MIVRKYEDGSGSYVEFWVNHGKVYCMVTSSDGSSLTSDLTAEDVDDLRNWLYDAGKQIEPKKEN